jgi:hypothetical protein
LRRLISNLWSIWSLPQASIGPSFTPASTSRRIQLPGLSLGIFGQYFNRHESWAEMARPWVDYIARSSYLLQQGRFGADIAVFNGEDTPVTTAYPAAFRRFASTFRL